MSSRKISKPEGLASRVDKFGVVLILPCDRCHRLDKVCVKAEFSSRCSSCIRAGNCRCAAMPVSESSWKRLVSAQDKIEADEEKAREEMAALMARMNRLQKQKKLLRKRAGEFIQTDIKDVEELERLEEEEEKAREEERRKEAERQKANEAIAVMLEKLPSDPSSADPFDPVLFDQLVGDIPGSFLDNSGA